MPWLLRMTVLVAIMMAAIDLYLIWRTSKAVSGLTSTDSTRWKKVPMILFFSFFLFPVAGIIYYFASGSIDVLGFPKLPVYWFWFGLVFTCHLFTWIVIADLANLSIHYLGHWDNEKVKLNYSRAVVGLSLVVFLYTGVKMYNDTTRFVLDTMQLEVENLPSQLDGLRIIHISDLQADEYTGSRELRRYVKMVNDTEPHLVIFTGDLISYGTRYIEMAAEELSNVRSEYGIYAVVGDHDYWAGLKQVEPALESRNIVLLKDQNKEIRINDSLTIHLTGITNVYSQLADKNTVDSLVAAGGDAQQVLRILASHQISPYMPGMARESNYDLILGGHTHGGQVRVPLFWKKLSASNLETEFIQGSYRLSGMLININNGLGFTLAPVRYNAPASISVIELRAVVN